MTGGFDVVFHRLHGAGSFVTRLADESQGPSCFSMIKAGRLKSSGGARIKCKEIRQSESRLLFLYLNLNLECDMDIKEAPVWDIDTTGFCGSVAANE